MLQRFFSQLRWTMHLSGFHRCASAADPSCVLYWGNAPPPPSIRRQLTHPQLRVLHFPHFADLTHKQRASASVERQRRREADQGGGRWLYPSIPPSYVLPDRLTDWVAEHQRRGGEIHPLVLRELSQLRGGAGPRRLPRGAEGDAEAAEDAESAAYYAAHSVPSPPSSALSPAPVWILKPSARGSGHGVLVSDLRSPSPLLLRALSRPYVAQRYVERPLLLEGRKMDCRLYVALLSSHLPSQVSPCPHTAGLFPAFPFQVFLFGDGLVRLASEPYPGTAALDSAFAHLTNNAIARQRSPACGQAENRSFREWLRSVPDPPAVLRSVELCCLSALASSSSLLRAAASPSLASHFALLGFDVLLDDSYAAWLCEVNHLPDLQCSASPYSAVFPVDCAVKQRLIADLLSLIQLPAVSTGDGEQPSWGGESEGEEQQLCAQQTDTSEPQSHPPHCVGGFRRLV